MPLHNRARQLIHAAIGRLRLDKGFFLFAMLSCSASGFPADASGKYGELLLFPEFTQLDRFNLKDHAGLAKDVFNPGLNLFYALDRDRFRFLLEWLVDKQAQEVQRFQVGWRREDTTFWLGRFHNPIGYWNTRFHHGSYLMTSIARPGVMAYETSGGPLPMHLTGLYVEGTRELDEASIYYVLNAGVGPDLRPKRLDALDILEGGGHRGPGVTLRLAYQPTSFGPNEFGLSFSYTDIPGQGVGVQSFDQVVVGAFANWRAGDFGFLGEALYIRNDVQVAESQPVHDVVNLYGQGEWHVGADWTLYGRVEGTFNAKNDLYFDHFQTFVRERFLGGVRYELPYNMALKVEVSRDTIRDDSFGQVGMQWSAVFP